MPDIIIKRFQPYKNTKEFLSLKKAYLLFFNYEKHLKYLSFTQRPFDEETVSGWLKNRYGGVEYHVALDNHEEIIGILIIKHNRVSGFELLGLVVHPEHEFDHIGAKLMDYGIKYAKRNHYKAIDTGVYVDNKDLMILCIRFGFIPTSFQYHKRADGCDILEMKKYHLKHY